jgi:hypothetical protein
VRWESAIGGATPILTVVSALRHTESLPNIAMARPPVTQLGSLSQWVHLSDRPFILMILKSPLVALGAAPATTPVEEATFCGRAASVWWIFARHRES